MQLCHAGRQTSRTVSWKPVAPSAVKLSRGGMFSTPQPLSEEQIAVLVQRFGQAAAMAQAAGFDGVQIHGAHGYLVSQFLSPLTNLRSDRYGGDIDGRMRFLLESVRATRAATGRAFTIAVKLNSADFQRGGFTNQESMYVAQALEAEGIDLLEISGGSYEKPAMMRDESQVRESTRAREAFFLEYAERMREVVSLPLMVTGGFRSRAAMNAALASGATDLIGMARPLAVAPELAGQLVRGEIDEAPSANLDVGVRLFDDLLQIHWYQRQLRRMGAGRDPNARLGRASTLAMCMSQMSAELTSAWLRREGHALDAGPIVGDGVQA